MEWAFVASRKGDGERTYVHAYVHNTGVALVMCAGDMGSRGPGIIEHNYVLNCRMQEGQRTMPPSGQLTTNYITWWLHSFSDSGTCSIVF